jgi:tetratricopeptide (TPR) repeat protein
MNLSQLEESFKSAHIKGDWADIVKKAVIFANGCQEVRKFDAGIACLNKLALDVKGDKKLLAVVLNALGTAYWEKAQLKKALQQFEKALLLFKETGDNAGKAAILSIVGITYWRKCEWDKALEILEDALSLKTNREERFASLYGAFDRGFATLQNRIRMGRELEQPKKILQPLFSSTALHLITGNMEVFKTCLEESETLAKQTGQSDILKATWGISKLASQV